MDPDQTLDLNCQRDFKHIFSRRHLDKSIQFFCDIWALRVNKCELSVYKYCQDFHEMHACYNFNINCLAILNRTNPGTRQFTDKTIHRHGFWRQFTDRFEDSSPTLLKTVHRHFLSRYFRWFKNSNWLLWRNIDDLWFEVICWYNLLRKRYFACLIND